MGDVIRIVQQHNNQPSTPFQEPPPEKKKEEEVGAAGEKKRRDDGKRGRRLAGTILTSPLGVTQPTGGRASRALLGS